MAGGVVADLLLRKNDMLAFGGLMTLLSGLKRHLLLWLRLAMALALRLLLALSSRCHVNQASKLIQLHVLWIGSSCLSIFGTAF